MLLSVVALTVTAILWIFAARRVSLVIDRLYTVAVESPPLDQFAYEAGVFDLGPARLYMETADFQHVGAVSMGSGGRVSYSESGGRFPFGPGVAHPTKSGWDRFEFTPDPGDSVRLEFSRSLLSWPVFETNYMTGSTPSWRRGVYCRLTWLKRSGAKLEIVWRIEQGYYKTDRLWSPPEIHVMVASLLRTRITEASDIERAANEYLEQTKHWNRSEYRLEDRGPSADGGEEVMFALHQDDERAASPGAGKSVELRVSYASRRVTREIAGQ